MAGVAFAVDGDGVGFSTESYAASALYTMLASLSGALWRIRRVNIFEEFEFDEHQLDDGSQADSVFPNELPSEERERLINLSESELAEEGWTLESVTRFSGPLLVEQV